MAVSTLRVLVVEDDAVVRRSFRAQLAARGHDPVSVGAAAAALAQGPRLREVHAAVVDYDLPDMRGDALIRELRRDDARLCSVLVSGGYIDELRAIVVETPVSSFIPKPVGIDALAAAVVRAAQATAELRALMTNSPHSTTSLRSATARWALSPREIEIAELLLRAYTHRGIAAALSIKTGTVGFHIANIKTKLGVHDKDVLVDTLRSVT